MKKNPNFGLCFRQVRNRFKLIMLGISWFFDLVCVSKSIGFCKVGLVPLPKHRCVDSIVIDLIYFG